MARHTLYAYAEGCDSQDLADDLERRFTHLVRGREWNCPEVWVVKQPAETDSLSPDDQSFWDVGVNVELPDPGREPKGWFSDIQEIALFLAELHQATGIDFVIGIFDAEGGFDEDLFSVDSDKPDLAMLREIIGVGEIE